MALDSFTALQASVANWLNRDDLTSVIPDLITMGEQRLFRQLRLRSMVKVATATLDETREILPADFLEAITFTITSSNPPLDLEYVSPAQMNLRRQNGAAGTPTSYTILGEQILFHPAPTGSPTLEMAYYARPDPLSASNASNVILEDAPDLYLYASLLASAPFLREDERLGMWGTVYDTLLAELTGANQRSAFSAAPLVIKIG